jgi:hypothetical protein
MSPAFQSIAALVIVALAATWLGCRWFGKRKNVGCVNDCGCNAQKITPSLKRK